MIKNFVKDFSDFGVDFNSDGQDINGFYEAEYDVKCNVVNIFIHILQLFYCIYENNQEEFLSDKLDYMYELANKIRDKIVNSGNDISTINFLKKLNGNTNLGYDWYAVTIRDVSEDIISDLEEAEEWYGEYDQKTDLVNTYLDFESLKDFDYFIRCLHDDVLSAR